MALTKVQSTFTAVSETDLFEIDTAQNEYGVWLTSYGYPNTRDGSQKMIRWLAHIIAPEQRQIDDAQKKYVQGVRYVCIANHLFDESGSPILQLEANGTGYVAHDIKLIACVPVSRASGNKPDIVQSDMIVSVTGDIKNGNDPAGKWSNVSISVVANRAIKDNREESGWRNLPMYFRVTFWSTKDMDAQKIIANKNLEKGNLIRVDGAAPQFTPDGYLKTYTDKNGVLKASNYAMTGNPYGVSLIPRALPDPDAPKKSGYAQAQDYSVPTDDLDIPF